MKKTLSKKIADKRYRDKIKHYIESYKKSKKCEICGEARSVCLDFHHRDKKNKDYTIGRIVRDCGGMRKVKREISKCMIVCSNCHRVLHADDNRENLSKKDELPLFD